MDCDESISEARTIQDVPLILSPQLRDIFPIFASMLDIKSFMKLAMTSKDMYKRCMEDKSIKINVNENLVYGIYGRNDKFNLNSSIVSDQFLDTYLSTLKKMRCTINLQTYEMTSSMTDSARQYLAEIGVKRIEKLSICYDVSEWNAVFPFIKDFHINIVEMHDVRLSLPVLRSLLQLNLEEFSYNKPVPVDLLFEITSPIPRISLKGTGDIPKDIFLQILWMIQSGSLTHLTLDFQAVDWSTYDKLPFYHKGAIPEDRPLLFARTPERSRIREYWFLHWQGGVTKCVVDTIKRTLEVFKCEPYELPLALRKEEDVMNDLKEMRSGVSCLLKHFRTFSDSFSMLDPSLEGPLPTERPLYSKASETSFWRLDKNDNLASCSWENGCITWTAISRVRYIQFGNRVLSKYMFWKLMKESAESPFAINCESAEEFNSWLEGYKTFDYFYGGPLPDERPLVIGEEDAMMRNVVFDGFRFKCQFRKSKVYAQHCSPWECPKRQITVYTIKEILQDSSLYFGDAYVNIRVSLKTFRDGLKLFESMNFEYSPFVCKSTRQIDGILMDECWYSIRGTIMKVVWKEGRFVRTPGDLREFPLEFTKIVFKELARQGECKMDGVFLKLEQFQSCLEQFTVLPFDYSGPMKSDFPLVFSKKGICHTDEKDSTSQCSDACVCVFFLWEDMSKTHCSWSEREPQRILFKKSPECVKNMPPALKSKEYLEMLLKLRYDKKSCYLWFGDAAVFLAFFNDFKKFPFDYKGDLPTERPLVFENDSNAKEPVRFFLREDNSIVKFSWDMSMGVAHLYRPKCKKFIPPALWVFV